MSFVPTCVIVLVLAGALLLVGSGAAHLRRPGRLAAVLATHQLLPASSTQLIGWVLPGCELVVGLGVALSWARHGPLAQALAATQGVLYAALAAYAGVLVRARAGADCGCGGREAPASALTVARAGVLATVTLGGGVLAKLPDEAGMPRPQVTAVWLLAATLEVVLWVVPHAPLWMPAATPRPPDRR